jgi:signal transduction histidine kinase
MKLLPWQTFYKLRDLLKETAPPADQMALRLQAVERDVILPVKAVFVGILVYNFIFSRWFEDVALTRSVAHQVVVRFFLIYLLLNAAVAFILVFSRKLPTVLVQRVIFTASFVDGLFLAALTFVTGGFDSLLYWLFPGLIMRNALSSPLAVPQIILNLSAIFCYLLAGLLDVAISDELLDFEELGRGTAENPTEPFLLRLFVLLLMAACCYGIQVLFEKQRQALEEAREFTSRQAQLRSAGRLAAQIAHQIKNPLGIINNAAFSLQRAIQDGKSGGLQQVQIIREEVERSDRILTKLMGYAQLAEGKVEKLHITEELERAIAEVFPAGAKYEVKIERDYSLHLPLLLMQRGHLSEILVNILQNAREATGGKGLIEVSARPGGDNSVQVIISDNGPGIPEEKLEKIFQPYFSTKEKGTGLGLSIVKHNTEIYNGTVRVESGLGKGTRFTLHFPTRTFMKFQR